MKGTRAPFTVEQGMDMQRKHLEKWRLRLSPECYAYLRDRVEYRNSMTDPKDGYGVCRGTDLDHIISNWQPKHTTRVLTFTDEDGAGYTTQGTGERNLSEMIETALEHYPSGMGRCVRIEIENTNWQKE